ncbi:FAD dependent oxidoreductase [Rhodocollybia butyracea]|uniref:L-ornithine N(5)-monooxygenase [NAD(P)H] n=1 Tax=Rhodocollybia butyracea TaxID=206335 RepID=A0A9P5PMD9_9AGAR|nr:FAD dependent oxidoreductase [Rhodocollybia butyracea]
MGSLCPYDYDLDVLVVGAGFSGIYQLYHLRKLGFLVKIFEAVSDPGGVWAAHFFPGARVDVAVPGYEFSSEDLWKDWYWTERYPSQKELKAYFTYVVKKLDLRKDMCFNTRVVEARFDSYQNKWIVKAENGSTARTRFLVTCLGFGSKPYTPDLPNLLSFRGNGGVLHTSRWPSEGVDLKNKRVGVIGTGASGVQVIQEIAKDVQHLVVFQRTPNMALPMQQTNLTKEIQDEEKKLYPTVHRRRRQTAAGYPYDMFPKKLFDASPEERLLLLEEIWRTGGFSFILANFNDILTNPTANEEVYAFWRQKVSARLKNPELQEKLAPKIPPHYMGAKRSSLEQHYYEVYNQSNVELVDIMTYPITEITTSGVKTPDKEYELDVLVLATGYDSVTGGITQIDIRGVDGTSIEEKWKDGIYTHLGFASSGFPNLFFVFGPQSVPGVCAGPTCAETQGEWVIACIRDMTKQGLTRIEATREAEIRWRQQVMDEASSRLISTARSWYMGANVQGKKREILMYTGGAAKYTQICKDIAEREYEGFMFSSNGEEHRAKL